MSLHIVVAVQENEKTENEPVNPCIFLLGSYPSILLYPCVIIALSRYNRARSAIFCSKPVVFVSQFFALLTHHIFFTTIDQCLGHFSRANDEFR